MGHIRTSQAGSDLDEIWYYVATKSGSLEVADRLIDSITERFFLVAKYPNLGRARNEDLREGLRSLPAGEYIIIYRIQDGDVVILRVLHASRDIEALLGLGLV
jgi:toxin ParE1/3/4